MVKAERKHNIEDAAMSKPQQDDINTFRREVLAWYDENRRVLPWRALAGNTSDPYHVWLSEIMLQQTVVAAVIPYFLKFIEKWPRVHDLAQADNDDVMTAWAGLGYYARARNLHKCAKIVSEELRGVFPIAQKALQELPGIGDYTSAAIRAIAFDKPAVVVDGNIERVMARFHAVTEPLPAAKKTLKALTADYAEGQKNRSGDFAQALMDLGATVCTPKSPKCGLCPLPYGCDGYKQAIAETLPRKAPKKIKPEKHGLVYWVENGLGEVLLEKRQDSGLLGGMSGLPTTEWHEKGRDVDHLKAFQALMKEKKNGEVYHSFTHFNLSLKCVAVAVQKDEIDVSGLYYWSDIKSLKAQDFPTLFSKCLTMWR